MLHGLGLRPKVTQIQMRFEIFSEILNFETQNGGKAERSRNFSAPPHDCKCKQARLVGERLEVSNEAGDSRAKTVSLESRLERSRIDSR